ncbi:MAG TPA: alpha/beta hydrolase, partial [Candidatus Ventrisoma faecale]|nr:alpha/beta hydrolase [Candidatus Ventrisoma faecale]
SLLGHLDTISPRPVLMLAGENAMSRGLTEGVYERLGEAKELIIVPGANHVDLYDDTEKIPFDEVERFLNESLKPGA